MLAEKGHMDFCNSKLIFKNQTLAYISSGNIIPLIGKDVSIVPLKLK